MANNAVAFDGTTQYAKIDNFAGLQGLTDYTIEFWVKNTTTSAAYDPLVEINDAGSGFFATLSTENGVGNQGFNFGTDYATTNADGYESGARLTQNTWVHVALSHNATIKKSQVFINGIENSGYDLRQTGVGALTSSNGMQLVFAQSVRATPDRYFDGAIGGFIRVWNRCLNGTEIYARYDKTIVAASLGDSSLIVNVNFTEESGTVSDNDATAGEDLDLVNTPSWTTGPTLSAASYPTALYRQIAASADDAEENRSTTAVGITSTDYEIPADGGVAQRIGWRWNNITIAPGSTITAAYIRLAGESTQSGGPVTTVLTGDDTDDAAAFTTTNADISGRTDTTASVNWNIGSSAANSLTISPDVSSIIQEIIDRAGWASGNDLAIVMDCTNNAGLYGRYWSYNGQEYSSAQLYIEYTAPSGTAVKDMMGGFIPFAR